MSKIFYVHLLAQRSKHNVQPFKWRTDVETTDAIFMTKEMTKTIIASRTDISLIAFSKLPSSSPITSLASEAA